MVGEVCTIVPASMQPMTELDDHVNEGSFFVHLLRTAARKRIDILYGRDINRACVSCH